MPDTKTVRIPGGWPPSEEISAVGERELREWMKEISDDLKAALKSQSSHEKDSAVFKENINGRVEGLEKKSEEKRGFWGRIMEGGIAAGLGAAVAMIGRKSGLWTLLALMLLVGCGTPESLRETNYLNGEAARWIVEASPDPAIDRAAGTIAAGTDQIARKLGEPEVKPAYTPDVHDATVEKSKADLDAQEAVKRGIGGFFENIVTKGADLLWPGLGGTLIGAFFWLKKKLQFDKLKAGAQVVVRAGEKIPAVKEATAALASKLGVGKQVDDVVQNLLK